MSRSETKKRKKWVIVLYIVSAMAAEAVFVLWPLACACSDKGLWAMWSAMDEESLRSVIAFAIALAGGLIGGLIYGLCGEPGRALVFLLIFGLAFALIVLLTSGLGQFTTGFALAVLVGSLRGLGKKPGLGEVLIAGLFLGFLGGFLAGVVLGFASGVLWGLGIFVGVPLGTLLIHGLKQLPEGFTSTFQGFFTPWKLKTYSLGKAIASFAVVYAGTALLFSLWFNVSYLGGTDEDPAFDIPEDGQASWGDFVYFSFVTITTLGYGDIAPLHTLPKVLVVLETVMGVGWVVVYIGMMLHVAPRTAERQSHPQNVKVIRPTKDTRRLRRWRGRSLKKRGM